MNNLIMDKFFDELDEDREIITLEVINGVRER